mmetsp:Transcript_14022/g.30092  ORF Transcript_14022/g.30092 Transcript_14022/m.30092 type:complete len:249 (-) Transcript_14022:1246-1992(-)
MRSMRSLGSMLKLSTRSATTSGAPTRQTVLSPPRSDMSTRKASLFSTATREVVQRASVAIMTRSPVRRRCAFPSPPFSFPADHGVRRNRTPKRPTPHVLPGVDLNHRRQRLVRAQDEGKFRSRPRGESPADAARHVHDGEFSPPHGFSFGGSEGRHGEGGFGVVVVGGGVGVGVPGARFADPGPQSTLAGMKGDARERDGFVVPFAGVLDGDFDEGRSGSGAGAADFADGESEGGDEFGAYSERGGGA